jgi:hypothetical protein
VEIQLAYASAVTDVQEPMVAGKSIMLFKGIGEDLFQPKTVCLRARAATAYGGTEEALPSGNYWYLACSLGVKSIN